MTSSATPLRRAGVALTLLLALLACALMPAGALADGDPGSDVLQLQNLFVASDSQISPAQQLQLGALLSATAAAGDPVRVAIISRSDDLGTVTSLWREPQRYAKYLGAELADTYPGRLLIVMPDGLGVYWQAKHAGMPGLARALSSISIGSDTPGGLVAATEAAVYRLEALAGVNRATLAKDRSGGTAPSGTSGIASTSTTPASSASATPKSSHGHPDAAVIAVAVLLLLAYVAWRRGMKPPKLRLPSLKGGVRIKPVALLPTALLAIVVLALVLNHSGSDGPGSSLDSNPNLDGGTQIHPIQSAPNFTLYDETGQKVSLSQYRGKVVILAFIDAECQTICPLTTTAMLDAKRSLGAAGKDVQLLGVNANWKSTQIDDVLNYTELHGLTGQWHFLTSSAPGQLQRVWRAYKVDEQDLVDSDSNAIDHVAAVDIIDPQGRWRTVYTTSASYGAIPQFGQLLAEDASSLLPSHPKVSSHYSYAQVRGITPAQPDTLPLSGGGTTTLGPGRAHLYLFFATWDVQTTEIQAEMAGEMNTYARTAMANGLPALTAVDEGSVEPSPAALPRFLKTLAHPLSYPVAIDSSGRVGDGYDVEGDPWLVLVSKAGQIVWYQEIYTSGWPDLSHLKQQIRAGLSHAPTLPTNAAALKRDLAGSPPVLAKLHDQGSELLSGGNLAFYKRIAQLKGHPVVVNIWSSTCTPCQKEFGLFANAAALYGPKVAFLGADNEDSAALARAFLRAHPVSYPSYQTQTGDLGLLLPGGLEGTPTTVYISAKGTPVYTHTEQYVSQGTLDQDIEDYALSGQN